MIDGHVDVRGIDGQEQRDQSPRGQFLKTLDQQHHAEHDFKEACGQVQRRRPGQIRRHDPQVESGVTKVIEAREDEDRREQVFHPYLECAHFNPRRKV